MAGAGATREGYRSGTFVALVKKIASFGVGSVARAATELGCAGLGSRAGGASGRGVGPVRLMHLRPGQSGVEYADHAQVRQGPQLVPVVPVQGVEGAGADLMDHPGVGFLQLPL